PLGDGGPEATSAGGDLPSLSMEAPGLFVTGASIELDPPLCSVISVGIGYPPIASVPTNGQKQVSIYSDEPGSSGRTHAVQQTSGRAFPAVSFVYLSVECPSNKFYGINCRPKLGAKLLDRFFHRRRQVSPPVNRLTHRFFDGSQHFLYCNFTLGSRH